MSRKVKKIKSQEEEMGKLKKDNIEKNICKVINSFKKSLNLTQHQILQLKLNPYYLSQVRENLNLKNQINKLKCNERLSVRGLAIDTSKRDIKVDKV